MPNKVYTAYILSPKWLAKRREYWASDWPQECYVCGIPYDSTMHMHHLTYVNFQNERLCEIVPVCKAHHKLIHQIVKRQKCSIAVASRRARLKFQPTNPASNWKGTLNRNWRSKKTLNKRGKK